MWGCFSDPLMDKPSSAHCHLHLPVSTQAVGRMFPFDPKEPGLKKSFHPIFHAIEHAQVSISADFLVFPIPKGVEGESDAG